ncbi:type I 3-dehydroquinate dehydratase [Desulfobacterota bacterium M19]
MQKENSAGICVAVSGGTVDEVLKRAQAAQAAADVIEIRLDGMEEAAVEPFIEALEVPLLFTNRASWEGGKGVDDEETRLDLLYDAVASGAAYIDLELKTADEVRQRLIKAAKGKCKTIISWHNFSTTPSAQGLRQILQEQYRTSAAIGKIVTMAHDFTDVLRVLDLQREARELGFPLIAFCMGRVGAISRAATLEMGGFMTYAAADGEPGTAPGQLAVSSLRHILRELDDVD